MPGRGGYQAKAVISSFIGALPSGCAQLSHPCHALFEPEPAAGIAPGITAGVNAGADDGANR